VKTKLYFLVDQVFGFEKIFREHHYFFYVKLLTAVNIGRKKFDFSPGIYMAAGFCPCDKTIQLVEWHILVIPFVWRPRVGTREYSHLQDFGKFFEIIFYCLTIGIDPIMTLNDKSLSDNTRL